MATVRDLMSAAPVTVRPATSLAECATKMMRLGVRHLPVVEDGVFGLLDDNAVFSTGVLVDGGLWFRFDEHGPNTAGAACSPALELDADDDLTQALPKLRRKGAAVVLDEGAVVGVLSEHDVVAVAGTIVPPGISVASAASRPVHTVEVDVAAHAAVARMRMLGVRHLVLVDGGLVAGVVSLRDIVGDWHDPSTPVGRFRSGSLESARATDSLRTAAMRMHEHDIGCLPVLDAEGGPDRIVTRTDVLDAVASALENEALFPDGED
ncbi:MAG: CBS domain-containing protein [Myxococcota bacterium]